MVGFRDKVSFRGKRHQFSGGHKKIKITRNFRRFRRTFIYLRILFLRSSIQYLQPRNGFSVDSYLLHHAHSCRKPNPLRITD